MAVSKTIPYKLYTALYLLSATLFECLKCENGSTIPKYHRGTEKACSWHVYYFLLTIPQCNGPHFTNGEITVERLNIQILNLLLSTESTIELPLYGQWRINERWSHF